MKSLADAMLSVLPFITASLAVAPMRLPLRTPQPAVMLLGGGCPEVPFASSYKPGEINALWASLKKVYGNEAAARAPSHSSRQKCHTNFAKHKSCCGRRR